MRIFWVDPIGADRFSSDVANILRRVRREGTEVDVMYLGPDRPKHLEYHAYEAMVIGDIVRLTYAASAQYDAIVIGCFYDVGLREAREVSRQAVVTAPCQSAVSIAAQLGNTFLAPFKFAEFLAETARKLGWYPSRKWGSEAPPTQEIEAWQLFKQPLSELGGIL